MTEEALPGRYLAMRPTVNPYFHALRETWNRLRWDLRPVSWSSRYKLKAWKDRYMGEKAVIVCNGPSLLRSDLSLVRYTFTFGLNKINLLFERSEFRPSCVVATADPVMEQNAHFFNSTDLPLFLRNTGLQWVRHRQNTTFLHVAGQYKFARDCSVSIFGGGTVTFAAMELAFHMGFSEVALIGADHSYSRQGPGGLMSRASGKDPDHFDPNYFADGVQWQHPEIYLWDFSYSLARDVYEQSGRRLFNATEGGRLEVLPRISLAEFIGPQRVLDATDRA